MTCLSGILFAQIQTRNWRKNNSWQSIFDVRQKQSAGGSLYEYVNSKGIHSLLCKKENHPFLDMRQGDQMCGTQVPPTGRRWYNSWTEISSLELNLYWGNIGFQSFPSLSRVYYVLCNVIVLPFLLYFTQDYASLSHLHILVKASLVLHGHAKNMMLRTPDTDVSRTALCINSLSAVYNLIHSLCLGVLS